MNALSLPTLSNIRVYSQPSSNDDIVLECNMKFFTDAHFNATAKAKVWTLKVTAQAFITSLIHSQGALPGVLFLSEPVIGPGTLDNF
jgi:hypothetical protein